MLSYSFMVFRMLPPDWIFQPSICIYPRLKYVTPSQTLFAKKEIYYTIDFPDKPDFQLEGNTFFEM